MREIILGKFHEAIPPGSGGEDAWSSSIKTPGHGKARAVRAQAALVFAQNHFPDIEWSVQNIPVLSYEKPMSRRTRVAVVGSVVKADKGQIYKLVLTPAESGWYVEVELEDPTLSFSVYMSNSFQHIAKLLEISLDIASGTCESVV